MAGSDCKRRSSNLPLQDLVETVLEAKTLRNEKVLLPQSETFAWGMERWSILYFCRTIEKAK